MPAVPSAAPSAAAGPPAVAGRTPADPSAERASAGGTRASAPRPPDPSAPPRRDDREPPAAAQRGHAGGDDLGRPGVWAVVAGGGTIGHLTPGLATAEALVARGCPRDALHFVGSVRGVEASRLPSSGYPLTLLAGRGIRRRLTWSNVGAVAGLGRAFIDSLRLLRRERPAAVLATGGYASASCAVAAVLSGVPLVVAEQNAVLGSANRLALRLGARAVALSFPDTPLPRVRLRRRPLDVVVAGNPVRAEMLAIDRHVDRAPARRRLGVPVDRTLVVVYGGSLGARRLNTAATDARRRWRDRADLAVRHVIGDRDWPRSSAGRRDDPGEALLYQPVRYEDDLPSCLAAADLVVSRAGASSVAELTCVGVPSVLVPLPGAPGDHQTANARHLQRVGAAVLVADGELDGARLVEVVGSLIDDPDRLRRMADAAGGLGRRGAADAVADLLVRHARRTLPVAGPTPPRSGQEPCP